MGAAAHCPHFGHVSIGFRPTFPLGQSKNTLRYKIKLLAFRSHSIHVSTPGLFWKHVVTYRTLPTVRLCGQPPIVPVVVKAAFSRWYASTVSRRKVWNHSNVRTTCPIKIFNTRACVQRPPARELFLSNSVRHNIHLRSRLLWIPYILPSPTRFKSVQIAVERKLPSNRLSYLKKYCYDRVEMFHSSFSSGPRKTLML